jgi:hypothetical protein
VCASKEDRTVVVGRAVAVPYTSTLLDEPEPGTLFVW